MLSVATVVPLSVYGNTESSGNKGMPPSGPAPQGTPGGYGWQLTTADGNGATTPVVMVSVQTSAWINVIPEPTTTYTMKFALTTLTTVTVPDQTPAAKRVVQRWMRFESLKTALRTSKMLT
jgi:hypothetical protein